MPLPSMHVEQSIYGHWPKKLELRGGQVLEVPADIGDRAQVEAAFKSIREQLGSPEILLYNAGSGNRGTIVDITPEQYETTWRVNGYGSFLSAKKSPLT